MKIEAYKNTIKSSFWGIAERIFVLICAFIVRTVIVYKLGTEYVGLDGLFVSILNLLNLSELGLGSAIVFNMYDCIVREDYNKINCLLYLYRRTYIIIAAFILFAGIIVSFFLKSLIHGDVPAGMNVYVLFYLFLFNTVFGYLFASYKTSIFTAYQRNDLKSKIQFISDLFMYVFQITVLLLFSNYYLYVIAMLIAVIPRNIFYVIAFKKYYPQLGPSRMPDKEVSNDVFKRVIPLLGHKVGGAFLVSIDSIVISAFLGLQVLGKYNNYYYIVSSIIGLTTIIQQALLSGIGNKIIILNKEEIYNLYLKTSFVWRWIVGQCAICFICIVQQFIKIWIGSQFQMPSYIVVVLTIYYYLWQFRIIGLTFKDAAGLWKSDWYKPYLGMFLNAFFSILLVYITKNVVFVLVPTCFVFAFVYFPVETFVISRDIFQIKTWKVICVNLLHTSSIFVVGLLTYYLCLFLPSDNILFLILRVIVSLFIPNLVLLIIWHKSNTFKQIIPYIKKFKSFLIH